MRMSDYKFKKMDGMNRREKQQRKKKYIQKISNRIISLHQKPHDKINDWEKEELELLEIFHSFLKNTKRDLWFYLFDNKLLPRINWYQDHFKSEYKKMKKDTYVNRILSLENLDIDD